MPQTDHLGMIDDALDDQEASLAEGFGAVNTKIDAGNTVTNAKIDGLRTILIGLLITLTTASIMLALNLAFR